MKRVYLSLMLASLIQIGAAKEGRCFTPTLENGWVEAEENMRGDSFVGKFRCHPGFVLSGATTVKCRQGRWSVRPDNFPLCAAIGSCDAESVPQIQNGFKKANPRYKNSVYRYSCKKGYRLMGVSTVFCTQQGWSVGEAPVCTRAGCQVDDLMGGGVPNGRARAVWGGAALRFSCNAGSVMEGNQVVFCDGKTWNGTKPECLVPPGPPSFSLTVGGVQIENPSVAAGQNISLSCSSGGGNPAPSLALYLGGDRVVSSSPGSPAQYTWTVQPEHDSMQVYCTAHNKMAHTEVTSQVQVIRLKYPASNTYIRGSRLVMAGEYVQYSCSSDEADPAPHMEVVVTDQNGDAIAVNVEKMPKMKGRKGFAARIVFGVHFEDSIKIAEIECKAVNEVGEASSKMTTRVQYAPETVDISGNTVVKHDDEKVVYTCSSSESFPEPTIVWNKLVEGKLEKIEEDETEVETEETEAGFTKTSHFTLRPSRTHEETFLLFCIVKIPDLKFEKSSDLLDVTITFPPKRIFIDGPDAVIAGDEAEFTCVVEGGNPTPIPIMVITDQYQNALPFTTTSNSSISVTIMNNHQTIFASCFAGNEAGYLQNTKEVAVHYPPQHVVITGPEYVEAGEEAKYECSSSLSFPPAVMEWKAWSANGETVEYVTDDTTEDDKQTVSHLAITRSSVSHHLITVECTAVSTAGSAEHSLSTQVTYPPTHLLLTGPTELSPDTIATYYCSTDKSQPAVTLDWSVTMHEGVETDESVEEGVIVSETALEDGGVQTHSVMTLPEYFVSTAGKLQITCAVREAVQELNSYIDVTVEAIGSDSIEGSGDQNEGENITEIIEDNNDLSYAEYGQGMDNSDLNSYQEDDTLLGENSEDNGKMVKLEAVEYNYNENYQDEYDITGEYEYDATNSHNGIEKKLNEAGFSPGHEETHNVEDSSFFDQDDVEEPTFHQSESESVNVALRLGDSPTQHVELSTMSSSSKLNLNLCLVFAILLLTRL
eukprot:GFUD01042069.1.p1 GENE.GFUD01042069.1~~GFUD01042069.1.p1  ORF type:complete len:990 (-),score=267.58 GFUD01042069.1:133-3102(-)